jgi:hypothetical protein
MGAANRKCIAMGNAGGIYGPENEQNWLYPGDPANGKPSVASCFSETNTRWVRFWADWVQIKPTETSTPNWSKIDPQVQAARNAGMSIIVTAYAFPPYATPGMSTDPLMLPTDFSRQSHWGKWIKLLYQHFDRFAPETPGITIDALEVINEPNSQAKPQRSSATGPVTSHQKVFQMFNTADQIGAEHNHSLWLLGPALSDQVGNSGEYFTYYESWMDLFFTLGFRGNSKWIWTHHNYIDCESQDGITRPPTNSAAVVRSKLINKWSGYSDGDGPALFLTEGGSRLSEVGNSQTRQRDTVLAKFNQAVSSPGIGMFSNYLMYDAQETPVRYSGLRNRLIDNGAPRMVYPNSGTTGWRNVQTGHRNLRDWRGSENLGPWLQWDPALATMRPGHLAAFAIGGGNPRNCWINERVDSNWWTGWRSLGGECYSGPAAVSRASNIMDVFVKGPNENIWATAFTPGWWGGWWSLGGWATSDPAVCSMNSGQLELFVRGPDNRLYHKWWYGSDWSDWHPMDNNTWSSGPGAVSMTDGRMDVVVRGNNNQIYHYYYEVFAGWFGPYSLEAPTANGQTYASTAARICSWGNRRLDVFARGPNNMMYRRIFDDVWGKWEPVLLFSSGPYGCAVESPTPGHIDLLTVESSGNVYRWMYQY